MLHSTAYLLSQSTSHWHLNIDNGSMNAVVFLDIRKVFDTVYLEILSEELFFCGAQGAESNFFKSYWIIENNAVV